MSKNKDGDKMKKINKKAIIGIIIIISIFFAIILLENQVQAFNPDQWRPDSMTNVTGGTRFLGVANKIIGMVQVIGSVTSVVTLVVIGIKYIMGSVEEKAEYKKTMKPYIIGAVMVFGITNILAIIQNIVSAF